jgi:hypothetical protein
MNDETYDSQSVVSDDGSSVTADDVMNLQQEVMTQSKAIEDYILSHQTQRKTSESFSVLQTLFALFKSEVAANLSLKKAIAAERQRRPDTATFFKELSRMTRSDIQSFDDVYQFLVSQHKRRSESKQAIKRNVLELEERIEALERGLAAKQEELDLAEREQARKDDLLKRARSKLKEAMAEVDPLKSELKESDRVIEKLRHALERQTQQARSSHECEQVEVDEDEIARRREKWRRKLERQRQSFEIQIEEAIRETEARCDEELQRVRLQGEKAERELERQRARYEQELILAKEQMAALEAENRWKQESRAVERTPVLVNEEISRLRKMIDELREELRAKDEQIQTEERKVSYLAAQNHEATAITSQVAKSKEALEEKVGQLLNHIEIIKGSAAEKRQQLLERIRMVKEKHKRDIDAWNGEVQSKVGGKLKTIERDAKAKGAELASAKAQLAAAAEAQQKLADQLRVEEKRSKQSAKIADDLRVENERLRNVVREKSDGRTGSDQSTSELRRLRDVLGIDPTSPADAVVDAVINAISHRRRR